MSRLLNLRIDARAEAQAQIDAILDAAADADGRDLTDAEEGTLTNLRESVEALDGQIEVLQRDHERAESAPPPVRRAARRDDPRRSDRGDRDLVQVRSEPGPYGDGPAGMRRFLIDSAIVGFGYQPVAGDMNAREEATNRINQWRQAVASGENSDVHARAVAMTNLGGIVNPQFDPAMISRGIYDTGVTAQLCRRYPIFSTGDSISMPRVTTKAVAAIQKEGTAFNKSSTVTTAVKADLFTVATQAEVSLQAIERGVMSTELLQDELRRSWMEQLNHQVLYGDDNASSSEEPNGLLNQAAGNASQFINKADASASAAKVLGYMTGAKAAIWKADRRRPDAYVVGPDLMGILEDAKTSGGEFLIPPRPDWVQNMGGAGTLPEREGVMSEASWRRVAVYTDPAIGYNFKADGTIASAGTETRIIAMCRPELPLFYDGPMSYSYEQTLAGSGQVLLVVRGYAAANFHWRPEAWRVIRGTGTILTPLSVGDEVDAEEAAEAEMKANDKAGKS